MRSAFGLRIPVAAILFGSAIFGASLPPAGAADLSASPQRLDPYKNFKFRLKWDGQYVAGFSEASPLIPDADAVEHRSGGDPSTSHKSPGRLNYEPITFKHGFTLDPDFGQWAAQVWSYGSTPGSEILPASVRKNLYLEIYNEAGQLATAYKIYGCWPSEYRMPPRLGAPSPGVTIQNLTLQCEAWERDASVAEPPSSR